MKITTGVLLAVLSIATLASAATPSGLKGVVTDSGGAVIPHAMVYIHWDPSGSSVGLKTNVGIKRDLILHTNARGQFSADLPPGFYDVFVSAEAFSPRCRKVRVWPDKTATFSPKLNADPEVTRELGDRF